MADTNFHHDGGVDYLADERKKAQFDVDAMKIVWAGGQREFDISDRMARLVASDPAFKKDDRVMMDRKELFKNTLRKAAHGWKRIVELRLSELEAYKLRFFVDEPAYTDLHWGMFVPAIKGQGSEEQLEKWLPLAYKMQIIGCYAQTELGHGSNVQGLETTATFDPETDEFVINSPTLTSSKWWPGGLGKVSTHAIVYARLITDGKDHGINGFIVQLRSLDDHLPLPGITIGDIGLKFGNGAYNTMDNGVLRFDNVRIPRDQMLMRKGTRCGSPDLGGLGTCRGGNLQSRCGGATSCPWGFSAAEGVDRRRAGKKLFVRIFLLWLSRRIWRWTEPIGGPVSVPRIPSLMIVVSRGVYFTFYVFRISLIIAFALYSRIMLFCFYRYTWVSRKHPLD